MHSHHIHNHHIQTFTTMHHKTAKESRPEPSTPRSNLKVLKIKTPNCCKHKIICLLLHSNVYACNCSELHKKYILRSDLITYTGREHKVIGFVCQYCTSPAPGVIPENAANPRTARFIHLHFALLFFSSLSLFFQFQY